MEFFPLTAFQRYSVAEDRFVKYFQVIPKLDGGKVLKAAPEEVLPAAAHGRLKYFLKAIFQKPALADDFASSYNLGYEKRLKKPGDAELSEIVFEKRRWDAVRDLYDPERGYLVKKLTGEPRAASHA